MTIVNNYVYNFNRLDISERMNNMTEPKKDGILMQDKSGKVVQLEKGLTFKEAYSKVWDLREKRDGNYYRLGNL